MQEIRPIQSNGSTKPARIAWLIAGWICFCVGVIGVVLPGLPTTGPMLLALACFSKGSERLHHWLLNHNLFGPSLRRWQETRTIPLNAKITAVIMMLGSIFMVLIVAPLPQWALVATVCLILIGMTVVARIPHK